MSPETGLIRSFLLVFRDTRKTFSVTFAAAVVLLVLPRPAIERTYAQNAPLPAYDGPAQSPVSGQGTDVTMNVALRRGSERFGQNSSTPTWEVDLSLANYTNRSVSLGDILIVLETSSGSEDALAQYIARTGLRQTDPPRQIEVRRGLDWGVTVGAGESTPWPWGAVPAGAPMSAKDAFMMLLQTPWAKGLARGGFPVIEPRSQYVFSEKVMAPVGLRAAREFAVVLPPRILRAAPAPAIQPVFVFREDTSSSTFLQVSREDLSVTQAVLAPIALDATAPQWKRLMALNALAETDFPSIQTRLSQVAEDGSAPLRLRASAMLNLAVNRHAPSVEVMKRIFAAPGNPRLALVAIEALGEIGEVSAAPTVRGAIDSADDQLSRVAIRNAARLKDSEAVAPIAAALAATRDEGRMSLCVNALSEIGTPVAWETVVGVANNSRAPFQVRRAAILAIGEQTYAPGESTLITLLSAKDSDDSIQLNVISALGNFEDDEAVTAIVAAAGRRDDTVGRAAVGVLAKIKSPRAVEALLRIAGTAGHPQSGEAISKLGETKDVVAIGPLRTVLSDAARGGADRAAAFIAIKAIDTGQIVDTDRAVLWTAFTATRKEPAAEQVAQALIEGGFSDRSVVPALVAGLDERRNEAWFANVLLLRHLTGQRIGPEYRFGSRGSHEVDFARWRSWAAQNPAGSLAASRTDPGPSVADAPVPLAPVAPSVPIPPASVAPTNAPAPAVASAPNTDSAAPAPVETPMPSPEPVRATPATTAVPPVAPEVRVTSSAVPNAPLGAAATFSGSTDSAASAALPTEIGAALEAGVRSEKEEEWSAALRHYENAGRIDPSMTVFIDSAIARVKSQMGTAGADALRRAKQYDALGRTKDAITWYQRALAALLATSPDRSAAEQRLAALKAGQ